MSRWRVVLPEDALLGADAAQRGEGGLVAELVGVVPGGDEQGGGGVGADAAGGSATRGCGE